MIRQSGVLMPVSALPSAYGIGDFGKTSFKFVDLIKEAGFSLWQILPLNPLGYGHSPYQPFSSFAIDEIYIDLEALFEEGLIAKPASFIENASKVFYEEVASYKHHILLEAYKADFKDLDERLDKFIKENPWVASWSLFMMLKRKNNLISWNKWPLDEQKLIEKDASCLSEEEKDARRYEIWVQMKLYEQWFRLKKYANSKGVRFIGDVPFYVGFDSCDVWANQDCFLLDEETKAPKFIAGVPPDYFSAIGQRWGNPIYNWDLFEKDDFSFLIGRMKGNSKLYDILRLDHFRAFDTYWKIPSSCETAIDGEWVEAPGYKLFDAFLKENKEVEIIAEDLGELRPEVLVLRDHYDFPGMNVIEFTFVDAEYDGKFDNTKENMVAYIGTHDNDPFVGFASKMNEWDKKRWLDKLEEHEGSFLDKIIDYTFNLPAKYAIISMQDLLGLDSNTRLNIPSIINDVNWTWRLNSYEALEKKVAAFKEKNLKYKR